MDDTSFLEGEEFWASSAIDDTDNLTRNYASMLTELVAINHPEAELAIKMLSRHEEDNEYLMKNLDEVQRILLQIEKSQSSREIHFFQNELTSFRKKYKLGDQI